MASCIFPSLFKSDWHAHKEGILYAPDLTIFICKITYLSCKYPQLNNLHAHLGVPVPIFHTLECTFTTVSMYILSVILFTCKRVYLPLIF